MRGSFGGSYGLGRNSGSFNGGGGGNGGGNIFRSVGRVMRTRINGGVQDPFPSSRSSHTTATTTTTRSTTPPKTRNNNNNNTNNNNNNNNNNTNNNSIVSKHGLSVTCQSGTIITTTPVCVGWDTNTTTTSSYDDGIIGSSEVDDDVYDGWECLEDFYDPLFGLVPSHHEVSNAMLSLKQFLHTSPSSQSATEEILYDVGKDMHGQEMSAIDVLERASSVGSTVDWIEPAMQHYDQSLGHSCGWEKVYDAFNLLQTEPNIQKMVVSLSSDKAVWDAVLNNETVREIRDSCLNAGEACPSNANKNSNPSNDNSNVLIWIMEHMKGKLMEVVGNITDFVGGIFKPPTPDKSEESLAFSEKLKSSFLLTILVLLIVVVTRGSKS